MIAPAGTSDEERAQRQHYDAIADAYEQHYSDRWSTIYRERFINRQLLASLGGTGLVLEAMCGGGQVTGPLLDRGARVVGLDISNRLARTFRHRWPRALVVQGSMLDAGLADGSFDAVVIVGGLHHLQPHVSKALDEIHRLLRPGGRLCFCEPHQGSLPHAARRIWYRHDDLFEANEAALDLDALFAAHQHQFDVASTVYGGGPAYLFVFNSMVFRIPLGLKRWYAPPLLWLERMCAPLQRRSTSCFVIAELIRR